MPLLITSAINDSIFLQALDKHGISSLLAAIWEGHTNCVKILLNSVSCILFLLIIHRLSVLRKRK